jgi:hypothetical protein
MKLQRHAMGWPAGRRLAGAMAPVAAALLVALASSTALAGGSAADAVALSRKLDLLYRSDTSHGVMRMHIKTRHYERTLEMEMWTRGLDDTLVRIKKPRKERGVATLKKGSEMWNYLPKIRKTIRVPPSMMMGSWMGSDFTNDDLVRSSSWEKDYEMTWDDAAAKGKGERCIRSTPKPAAAVTWSKVVSCFVRADTAAAGAETGAALELPARQDFFDEKGRLARTMTFSDVKELGGRRIPATMTLKPLLGDKKGNETVIEMVSMDFGVKHPANTFSQANLRRSR